MILFKAVQVFVLCFALRFSIVNSDFFFVGPIFWSKHSKHVTRGKKFAYVMIQLIPPCSIFLNGNLSQTKSSEALEDWRLSFYEKSVLNPISSFCKTEYEISKGEKEKKKRRRPRESYRNRTFFNPLFNFSSVEVKRKKEPLFKALRTKPISW